MSDNTESRTRVARLSVTLLEHTPQPERSIAAAARICYAPVGAQELHDGLTDAEVERMVRLVVSSGHLSAVEHASFTFAIDGISRACSHQLVRHRLASYNQQSQRYVRYEDGIPMVVPPLIERVPAHMAAFESSFSASVEAYKALLDEGVPAEDARFLLPNATETKIVMSMNARELLHFFTLRTCLRAQWEIRRMALRMLKQVKAVAPVLFENAGPYCVRQPCPEGRFYCGHPWKKENAAPGS